MFVKDYDDGIRRVKRGNYAFLMESTMLDYVVQRDCNLTQVGHVIYFLGDFIVGLVHVPSTPRETSSFRNLPLFFTYKPASNLEALKSLLHVGFYTTFAKTDWQTNSSDHIT